MKMLTMFVLLCAGMALTNAAVVPEAEADDSTGGPSAGEEEEQNELTGEAFVQEAVQEAEAKELTGGPFPNKSHSRMSYWWSLCPARWTSYKNRCFLYIPTRMTWALAEKDCQSRGGNMASVHNHGEYVFIQEMIWEVTGEYPETWIGGSDAQQEGIWLWSDGSHFTYTNWCPGEPNNLKDQQHCVQMNFKAPTVGKCWDDLSCYELRPYVCAQNI